MGGKVMFLQVFMCKGICGAFSHCLGDCSLSCRRNLTLVSITRGLVSSVAQARGIVAPGL